MDTLKIDGIQTGIYLIKYSNLYPFLYVLKNAFGNSVKVLEWDPYFPDIDRSVELNIFLGSKAQVREWLSNEQFCFTKLLIYHHKYFFVEVNDNEKIPDNFEKFIQNKEKNDYYINIFTNITPEVERFKKKEILDIIFKNGFEKLKEITVIEEDILFNRDFVSPIVNLNDNENEIDVFFYGTPLNDILFLYSLKVEKYESGEQLEKPEGLEGLDNNLENYWIDIKRDLNLVKFNTELKDNTYLCFMVNTGKIQPKHLSLISKLVELFKMCNDLFKDKDKDKDKDKFSFLIEEDGEDSSNSGNGSTVKENIEIKFVKEEKKIIVEKIFIERSVENSEVLRGRIRGALNGKANGRVGGRLSGTIFGEFCKSKMGRSSDSKSQTIEITPDSIVKAFKQSFNLRFLPDPIVKAILKLSIEHNDIPKDKNFGCSVEDLEDNNEQNNQENNNKGTA